MRFRARDENGDYYIDAPTGFDAKRYARIRHEAGAEVELIEPASFALMDPPVPDKADVELRWEGNDFSGGGSPRCKRLQVREGGGDWRDLG